MIRPYQFILLCLLCGGLTLAVKMRDAAIVAELDVLRSHIAAQDHNTILLWQDVQEAKARGKQIDRHEERLFLLENPQPKPKAAPIRRPVLPSFARDTQLVGR